MSSQEEVTPIDIDMTTSERVRTLTYIYVFVGSPFIKSAFQFQVVDLLNQAALISADEKLTILKQVCSYFKTVVIYLVS